MSNEEPLVFMFKFVYAPFCFAIIIICSFWWRLREKDRQSVSDALDEMDKRLINAASMPQVEAMINNKLEHLNKSQEAQLKLLTEISRSTAKVDVFLGRMDERVNAVEGKLGVERRSNVKS